MSSTIFFSGLTLEYTVCSVYAVIVVGDRERGKRKAVRYSNSLKNTFGPSIQTYDVTLIYIIKKEE